MLSRAFALIIVSLLLLGSSGCAYGELRTVLRAQFASELNCAEVKIQKRALWYSYEGPDQYKISGCGVMRTYTCPAVDGLVSYDEPQCKWVEGDADAPKMHTDTEASPLDEATDEDEGDGAGEEPDEMQLGDGEDASDDE
jgi:hypothetical protein